MGNWFSTGVVHDNSSYPINYDPLYEEEEEGSISVDLRSTLSDDDDDDDIVKSNGTLFPIIIGDEPSSSSLSSPPPPPPCGLNTRNIVPNPTGHDIKNKYFVDIHRELGRGAHGVVHVCVHGASGEKFACKSISKASLKTEKEIKYLQDEVAVFRHLQNHPNVVSLNDVYEDDVAVHMVMELCRGGTLQDQMMKKGPYKEEEAARIIRTIVLLVQMMHEKGVIHRDLKPNNFIFANKSQNDTALFKVIDFGIAHFFKPGEKFHDTKGPLFYMAPEFLEGDYGPEVDIWSVGVTLYVLLSQRFPFWAENMEETKKAIMRAKIDLESGNWQFVSENAKDLILKMLNPDINKRITPDLILKHPWLQMYTD